MLKDSQQIKPNAKSTSIFTSQSHILQVYYTGTRLTYDCAHLWSTKESLTFEYLDISFL